ncbi:hypothetical protein [Vulcanisaeta distributa]|uniref:hypothetical protein n=1 Tax=Vulcanisaeta distributa TaxID=164451 RepID=UPI000A5DFD21|nr:hypothetical protein [Vulcanisaeta distributa]
MPIHLRVNPGGDIAERVVIVGDPERARQLSELLVGARLVNENRGVNNVHRQVQWCRHHGGDPRNRSPHRPP